MYNTVKVSHIQNMKADEEQRISVLAIIDFEHMVNSLDQSSLDLLQALIKKRISDAELAEVKKQRALSNLDALRANLVNTN
jgi:hypothetical protein